VIRGIVLAAGASSRMGSPKALLCVSGQSFVARVLHAFRDGGVSDAVVVVRPGAVKIADEIARAGYGRAIENRDPDRGQLSSLVSGLDAIDDAQLDAAVVTLVDIPLLSASTVARLLARASESSAPILRAAHGGRHGHPVVFTRVVFDALRAADPRVGAKAVMRAYPVEDVEVDDPGILRDIDTPEDYEHLR